VKKFNLPLLVFLLISFLFIFLRVYKINQSFYLFGDVGRDLFVLQDWSKNLLKPPLLGPQTSAISFNQSAIYFYYLFPFFILLKHSVYSTLVATIFLYLGVFGWLFYWYKKNIVYQWRLLALFFLVAIHPQFVLQQRLVWNPSLIAPFLVLSFWGWFEYQLKPQKTWLLVMMFSLAVAASLNYSILPTVIAVILVFAWQQRTSLKLFLTTLAYGIGSAIMLNVPTIAFELRHNFLLTRSLHNQEVLQQDNSLAHKFLMLTANIVRPEYFDRFSPWLFIFVVLFLITIFLKNKTYFKVKQIQTNSFIFSFLVFICSAFLLLVTPLTMHEHYMFGVLSFLLNSLVMLPKKYLWLILFGSSLLYLQPNYFLRYQSQVPHTALEKSSCLQTFCKQRKNDGFADKKIFVNTQSASHNHQALEYIFLLKEFGCEAIDTQEFNAQPVSEMLVVADRATFENGKTSYYELSQFGEADEVSVLDCKENLKLHYLKKGN